MESTTFEELEEVFETKTANIHQCLLWRDCAQDDTCIKELKAIDRNTEKCFGKIDELKSSVKEEQLTLSQLLKTNERLNQMAERLKNMLGNIPERLPKHQDEISYRHQDETATSEPLLEESPPVKTVNLNISTQNKVKEVKPINKQVNTYLPEIDYLSVDEFKQIPSYQKGRLKYDQINKFIEGFNLAFKAKYKIMKQKKSTMKDGDRKRYANYKTQENKSTEGCYFVVEDDLKDFGGMKIDNIARTMCTVLRHCGRIKEIRGGGICRYQYVDRY